MAEYDIAFARKFAEVAQHWSARGLSTLEDRRVVAYNSRLSMELSIKAFLERAGVPISKIRGYSHRLEDLLAEVDNCEVQEEIAPGVTQWVRGSRLRSVTVNVHGVGVPVGMVLEGEKHGASRYPNELRYGVEPKDFPPEALAAAAEAIAQWVMDHWDDARRKSDA